MVGGNLKKVAVTQIPFKPKLVDPKIIFHRGNHTTIMVPKKATLFTYERVYFGLTGCTAVWLYKYVLKKFIHPESCPCCCLSLGMYCIVTSQDYSYTEQSGRKEKKLPGEGEKMVRSCVKNWMWNGRKWRNFQDHLWTQKVGLSFAYLRKVLSNQILVLFFNSKCVHFGRENSNMYVICFTVIAKKLPSQRHTA